MCVDLCLFLVDTYAYIALHIALYIWSIMSARCYGLIKISGAFIRRLKLLRIVNFSTHLTMCFFLRFLAFYFYNLSCVAGDLSYSITSSGQNT